jgi:hypothetical protein
MNVLRHHDECIEFRTFVFAVIEDRRAGCICDAFIDEHRHEAEGSRGEKHRGAALGQILPASHFAIVNEL